MGEIVRINPATRISNCIINNKTAQNVLKYANNNPSMFESGLVFSIATVARPATIAVTPSDKENKKFYISRSIISGALDLMTNALYFLPLNRWINKTCGNLLKQKNTVFYNNPSATKAFKTLINRGGKFVVAPIQAALLFWVIPKTVDKWFSKKNKAR